MDAIHEEIMLSYLELNSATVPKQMDYFNIRYASRLLGISTSRLRHWEKIHFLSRSIQTDAGCFYSFQDLVSLKAAIELIAGGVSLREIARTLEMIRKKFPEIQSLSQLKFFSKNNTLFMRYDGNTFNPLTGQLQMNFEDNLTPPAAVFKATSKEKKYLFWFEYGLRYDIEGRYDLAGKAYRKALQLNPSLADCWNNLATIYYRRGKKRKAIRYYLNALKINPSYKLAYYNLGNIFEEIKKYRLAIKMYHKAIELDPEYFDAHFNLALVYDRLRSFLEARHHWEIYLRIDSISRWARYARERVEEINQLLRRKYIPSNE
jgi:tetratricopeptide (TPR) repeat protein